MGADMEGPSLRLVPTLKAYALDWIAAILMGGATLGIMQVGVTEREYSPEDPSINFPYKPDTISNMAAVILSLGIPIACAVVMQFLMMAGKQGWAVAVDLHHFVLGIFETFAAGHLVTVALKHACGRVRPSGIERLEAGISSWNRSFASGHTSLAFSGFTFLALYLCGKAGVFSSHGLVWRRKSAQDPYGGSFAASALTLLVPLSAAGAVGVTRILDYAHHFSDVNAGAMIGMLVAAACYFTLFESLTSEQSHLARPCALAERREKAVASTGPLSPVESTLEH